MALWLQHWTGYVASPIQVSLSVVETGKLEVAGKACVGPKTDNINKFYDGRFYGLNLPSVSVMVEPLLNCCLEHFRAEVTSKSKVFVRSVDVIQKL